MNVCPKSDVFLSKSSLEIATGESASPSKPISYQNPYSLIQQSVRRILGEKTSVPRGIPPMTQVNLRRAGRARRNPREARGSENPAIQAGAPALTPPTHTEPTPARQPGGRPVLRTDKCPHAFAFQCLPLPCPNPHPIHSRNQNEKKEKTKVRGCAWGQGGRPGHPREETRRRQAAGGCRRRSSGPREGQPSRPRIRGLA